MLSDQFPRLTVSLLPGLPFSLNVLFESLPACQNIDFKNAAEIEHCASDG
jgi:hypothetical protein